ncbi:hypothetical protein BGZ46_010128 [Entomortierella lignicola]|nr:hypothetical protein BGZ46_010128 [Entomortierella lignicola]
MDFVPKKSVIAHKEEVNKLVETFDNKLTVNGDSDNKDIINETTVTGVSATSEENQIPASENTNEVHNTTNQAESSGAATAVTMAAKVAAQKRTVHVGNIPFRVRWQDLKDLFRKAGRIIRADVALGPDNRSRGFGTVVFTTEEEAKKAITMFDQYQWQDRVIQVQEDRSNLENTRHQEGHGHGVGPGPHHGGPFFRNPPPVNHGFIAGRQVFVGNLPFQCQWQDLKDLFRKAGDIIRADVALGFDGRSRGFGSVLFANQEDATTAISMFDNYDFNGRLLKVHYDRYTPMGHGPPIHGNIGHMMHHPHHPHPHPHPHQPHHPHRLHPMHAQHGHGFPPNFHQPPMMPLGPHPMIHGGNAPGQFNMGPPPFGGRNFSPSLLGPGSIHATEFSPNDSSVIKNNTSLPTDLPGLVGSSESIATPPQFDSSSASAIEIASSTTTSSSSTVVSGVGDVSFTSGSGSQQQQTHIDPPAQQFPFLSHLGPISKPNHHPGPGLVTNTTTSIPISEAGPSSDDDFVTRNTGNPYHLESSLGQGSGDDDDNNGDNGVQDSGFNIHTTTNGVEVFSPGFYIYPGFLQQHQQRTSQIQQQQQQQQKQESQQQNAQEQPLDQQQQVYQQHQHLGYPLYQDQYLQDQTLLGHPRNGVIGGMGANGPGHGYPSQTEWMGHPNSFMMGPFQHVYGLPQFRQYGHHRGLNGEIVVETDGANEKQR